MASISTYLGAEVSRPYDRRIFLKQLSAFAALPSIGSIGQSLEEKANRVAHYLDKSEMHFHDDSEYNFHEEQIEVYLGRNRSATVLNGALSTLDERIREKENVVYGNDDGCCFGNFWLHGVGGDKLVNPSVLHVAIYNNDLEIAHLYSIGSGAHFENAINDTDRSRFKYFGNLDGVIEFKQTMHQHGLQNAGPPASSMGNTENWIEDFEAVINSAYDEVLRRENL